MRLRDLAKLVEDLAGGGGPLAVESAAPVGITGMIPGDSTGWSLTGGFLSLGPLHLDPGQYSVSLFAEAIGAAAAGDQCGFALYVAESGANEGALWTNAVGVAADWPTSMFSSSPGQLEPTLVMAANIGVPCVVPTDLYLLMAAADVSSSGPPSAPVTVRKRRLSALPV